MNAKEEFLREIKSANSKVRCAIIEHKTYYSKNVNYEDWRYNKSPEIPKELIRKDKERDNKLKELGI